MRWRGFQTACAAILLILTCWVPCAGSGPPAPPDGQDRPEREDVVYFRNGDVVRGEVVNRTVRLVTPYAQMDLPVRTCACIRFETAGSSVTTVTTVNDDRLSGILTDRVIRFRSDLSGAPVDIRREKIARILLRRDPKETSAGGPGSGARLFLMANHDRLSGRPEGDGLRIWVNGSSREIPFSEAESIEIDRENGLKARVRTRGGTVLEGPLETEAVTLQLDLGVKVADVYMDRFDSIVLGGSPSPLAASQLPAGASDGVTSAIKKLAIPPLAQATEAPPGAAPEPEGVITNSIGMQLRLVDPAACPGGGRPERGRPGTDNRAAVQAPFYIGVYEVTQDQWAAVMGTNPSYHKDPSRPVEMVSWDDAREFCRKLSAQENAQYRLPTEAEWELACRAGTSTAYPWGNTFQDGHAWCSANSGGETHPAGTRQANPWGLHDMLGNVWEWCEDLYAPGLPQTALDAAAQGDPRSTDRALRGGGWFNVPERCRCGSRDFRNPDYRFSSFIGFRVARNP